jgi:hypothetical protein
MQADRTVTHELDCIKVIRNKVIQGNMIRWTRKNHLKELHEEKPRSEARLSEKERFCKTSPVGVSRISFKNKIEISIQAIQSKVI